MSDRSVLEELLDKALLTTHEATLLDHLSSVARLFHRMFYHPDGTPTGEQSDYEWADVCQHIHVLQRMISTNIVAREHPGFYRELQGDKVPKKRAPEKPWTEKLGDDPQHEPLPCPEYHLTLSMGPGAECHRCGATYREIIDWIAKEHPEEIQSRNHRRDSLGRPVLDADGTVATR